MAAATTTTTTKDSRRRKRTHADEGFQLKACSVKTKDTSSDTYEQLVTTLDKHMFVFTTLDGGLAFGNHGCTIRDNVIAIWRKMEQTQFSCGSVHDRLPPLSEKYQWFVAQIPQADEDGTRDQFFCNIQDPLSFYRCRIPKLHEKCIRASVHGWVILSTYIVTIWSLWDPVSSKIMHLLPLILKDVVSSSTKECCLSLPPDDPNTILLLVRRDKPTFVFCLLECRRKGLKWTEMPYAKHLWRISRDGLLIHSLCCCNGKVYALNTDNTFYSLVIESHIVVEDGGVGIILMLLSGCPDFPYYRGLEFRYCLRGSKTELFCIRIGLNFDLKLDTTFSFVSLHKLDLTSIDRGKLEGFKKWDITGMRHEELDEEQQNNMFTSSEMWEHMKDLKDGNYFVDLARDNSVAYILTIASEFGGNIHIRSKTRKVIYSYNLSDRTILQSPMFPSPELPTRHVSVWECRLAADYTKAKQEVEDKDHGIVVSLVNDDDFELNESRLLNLPFGVFEMIMEFCIGLEYLNFRATCKRCHLAAPVVRWTGEVALKRLQNYYLLSPWLMMVDKKRGIVTFVDPLYGYKYFMKKLPASVAGKIRHSRYGWLLYYSERGLVYCNPFTNEVHDLPKTNEYFYNLCISAPPTSPDYMVVGFSEKGIYIHFVHGEQTWRLVSRDNNDDDDDDDTDVTFCFPTFYGRDLYALRDDGKVHVLKNLGQEDYSWEQDVVIRTPRSFRYLTEYFLTKCDQHLLLVYVGHYGKSIEVFKLKDFTKEWEKTNDLGRRTIYISDTACLCIEAKTSEMQNKICFAKFYNKNGKVVIYSLETRKYHTFNAKNIEGRFGNFVETKDPWYAHAWIEPTWC